MIDPLNWVAGLASSLLMAILGILGFQVRKAHSKIDELNDRISKETVTKSELKDKLEDKMEAVKIAQEDIKEDIRELKEILKTLS